TVTLTSSLQNIPKQLLSVAMVTHRGRSRGKVVLSRGPKHKPAKVSKTPQRAWKDSQRRTAVTRPNGKKLPHRVPAKKEEQDHSDSDTYEDEVAKPERKVIRKSPRLKDLSGYRRTGVRRSTRRTRQTNRYQASNMFDGISNTQGGLNGSDNLKKNQLITNNKDRMLELRHPLESVETETCKRRKKRRNEKIYSKAQKKKTPVPLQRDLSDTEDVNGDTADVDSGLGTTADEDNNCSVNQDFNTRLGQGSSLYQGPSSEFLKGTFQINPSGTNTTCRRVF
ncbi:hypothetical protein AMECASPLE_028372, partial [Ameca splendens]